MSRAPRVLITRPHPQAMRAFLESQGALPVHVPLIDLVPTHATPPDQPPTAALITSATTAAMVPNLARILRGATVIAVGAPTAAALQAIGVRVAQIGQSDGAEAVALLHAQRPAHAWIIGAAQPSAALTDALACWGGSHARWAVYDRGIPADAPAQLARALPVDVATFASGSAVAAFCALAPHAAPRIAVIGPRTAEVARQHGLVVHAIAQEPTALALAQAALQAACQLSDAPAGG